jgi:hypothetical protein
MKSVYQFLIAAAGYFFVVAGINQMSDGNQSLLDTSIQSLIFAVLMSVFWFVYRRFYQRR